MRRFFIHKKHKFFQLFNKFKINFETFENVKKIEFNYEF